ncbi:hypothetical protein BAE44_0020123 [Dichanthelium oligosanthes]|uniref:F-box domain-containing protein n=1 Tax=Dichanthelium oligosanthes TaxID=888268 RepID=A0A1E5V142_9POAL|nr:hypothetical protein BAE44_0020123 [Dichanthelium oligosanthes]
MATSNRPHGDRLGALPDATLARVLSHLPTGEAVRSGLLSRRWRSVHTTVPVVALVDRKRGHEANIHDQPVCFDHQVTCALICRDPTAPIRALRLDVFHPTRSLLDQWIIVALKSGAEKVDVKLRHHNPYSRRRLCPFCRHEESSADFDYQRPGRFIRTPRQLFRSSTLRCLRLTNWTLDLPSGDVPSFMSLETLLLKRIMAPDGVLQRLVSTCRRLNELTLEECPTATEITVASAHLQSFTMVCCHKATIVVLGTPCLLSLRYKGSLPPNTSLSFFSIANHATITAVTVDICEDIDGKTPSEVATITELIIQCTNLTFLHLSLCPEMAFYRNLFTSVLRGLTRLRQLELKGCLLNDHAVASTIVLLQKTNNLAEVLSLFPMPPDPHKKTGYYFSDSDDSDRGLPNDHKHKVKRIRLVGYRGRQFERVIAKFLLSKAAVLDEICVSMANGCSGRKDDMARELMSWRCNGRARVTCA